MRHIANSIIMIGMLILSECGKLDNVDKENMKNEKITEVHSHVMFLE